VFLGVHGVRALVAERRHGLSTQPKARGQAPPTMEALRAAGIADRFAAAAPAGRPHADDPFRHAAASGTPSDTRPP
jgi:putative polyketide hydroxylase